MRVGSQQSPRRRFGYDIGHRMTSETNQRGFTEQTIYDFAGRGQREPSGKMVAQVQIQPVQTVGLFSFDEERAVQRGRAVRRD